MLSVVIFLSTFFIIQCCLFCAHQRVSKRSLQVTLYLYFLFYGVVSLCTCRGNCRVYTGYPCKSFSIDGIIVTLTRSADYLQRHSDKFGISLRRWNLQKRVIFLIFFMYSTLLHLPPLRFLCRRMLGSNQGQLRPRHWLSDALTTRQNLNRLDFSNCLWSLIMPPQPKSTLLSVLTKAVSETTNR